MKKRAWQVVMGSIAMTMACLIGPAGGVASAADSLQEGFAAPPESAKPRVWWHWMNGNITQDGITRDLEWMKRIGIGGFQNFDAALGTRRS